MKTAIVLLSIFALATARPEPRDARDVCGTTFNVRSGTIQSPNYPSSYSNRVDCTSTVSGSPGEVIRVTYSDFELESSSSCRYDYVELFDGDRSMRKDCGTSMPSVFETSPGNDLRVVFHSDSTVTRKGFDLSFSTETYVPPPPPSGNKPKECGKVKVSVPFSDRIVGGEEAVKNSIPWQVSLQKPSSSSSSTFYHFCGGSVISDTYIVTAAHCVENQDTKTWRIVAGAHTITAPSEGTRQIKSVIRAEIHESYNPSTFENDIAILELDSELTLNNYVQAICITKFDVTTGEVTVSGWGTLTSGGSSPDDLQYVKVDIISNSVCKHSDYYGNEFKEKSMICAGVENGSGKDSCQGDSGGPLFEHGTTNTLVGVVSWGYGCARYQKPGVYARVFNYLQWIDDKTGIDFQLP